MSSGQQNSQQYPRSQGTNIPPLPPANAKEEGEIRYSQIVEEQEHKLCTASNRIELQTQKLDRLRALKDEIAKDEWMFETTK